ncbi:pilus assembly protein [Yersinia ruckeri]|nr:pilus assembly protein [Yersinia ruckeri]MCK8540181.1 pilus assembly protein [Yersinia ruckeri]MCK8572262.1 pilus assembly protein [Yersinia ruckeri]MCK8575754.1 pilus assembly protein [Yersinia ruckeri]MCK8578710.1 pilus assembly protein [Yersinia ruckeri]MCK8582337.1 pilus assembly protein [Yersinia ruckeri]
MSRYTLPLLCLQLLFFVSENSYANLVADPTRTTIEGLQKNRTVRAYNSGDTPLYLDVTLVRIENPGEIAEIKTPIGEIKRPEMIFNPTRITLAPNQEREINLIPLQMPQQETLYRLYINPVLDLKPASLSAKPEQTISAPMILSIAYGVLIHHVPEKKMQRKSWSHQCVAEGIQLTATGNVRSQFTRLNLWSKKQKQKQKETEKSKSIYPGTPYIVPVKQLSGEADGVPFDLHCP